MDAEFRQWLAARLDRVDGRFDGVERRLGSIEVTQATHNEQLAEHMRRTDLLETRDTEFARALEPVAKHVDRINFLAALVASLITLAAAIFGIAAFFGAK